MLYLYSFSRTYDWMIGASNMIETENPQKKIPKYYWKG